MGKKRIISIGDIHGRTFWKSINIIEYDYIIFVGDYVDSTIYGNEQILTNLLDIIELKKTYLDKVILLLGNHDIQYMFLNEGYECSGYRPSMASTLNHIFTDNKELFQMAFQINNYIWTHAGISEKWYNLNKDEIDIFSDKFNCKNLSDIFNRMMYTKENKLLHQVGKLRGGLYPAGGITWADRNETKYAYLVGYHQIVGHTSIDGIERFGDDNSSITYIDCQYKLENLENFDDIRLEDYFLVLDLAE